MPTHHIPELGCTLRPLSYPEWLAIPEPAFFDFSESAAENNPLSLRNAPCLSLYTEMVSLAQVNGAYYKLNGKQRKITWESGQCVPPERLIALVVDMSETDFLALNAEVETQCPAGLSIDQQVKKVCAELGLMTLTTLFSSDLIVDVLNIALRGNPQCLQDKRTYREPINIKRALTLFHHELTLIQDLKPDTDHFPAGVLAGVLIVLAAKKDQQARLMVFLERLNTVNGVTQGLLEDPVASLARATKYHRMSYLALDLLTVELCRQTVHALRVWLMGESSPKYWRKRSLSGVDYLPYIRELKQLKHIMRQSDL